MVMPPKRPEQSRASCVAGRCSFGWACVLIHSRWEEEGMDICGCWKDIRVVFEALFWLFLFSL